ncbi:unnamed protein product [Protopolystoma xenopodis]|uniref:Uncharacterized protein n=1 Tax=Protopolystoma xenopodis TaxID=117903 RepID=A0A448XDJ8_9PLAT|nr:unnamed protein product [Protopolystoma xenopodis]
MRKSIFIRVENQNTSLPVPPVEYSFWVNNSPDSNLLFLPTGESDIMNNRASRSSSTDFSSRDFHDKDDDDAYDTGSGKRKNPKHREEKTGRSNQENDSHETKDNIEDHNDQIREEHSSSAKEQEGRNIYSRRRPTIEEMQKPDSHVRHRKESDASRARRQRIHFVWQISSVISHPACYPKLSSPEDARFFSPYELLQPVPEDNCDSNARPAPVRRQCSHYCGVRWRQLPVSLSENPEKTSQSELSITQMSRGLPCSARCGRGHREMIHICEEHIIPPKPLSKAVDKYQQTQENSEDFKDEFGRQKSPRSVRVRHSRGYWRPAELGEVACIRAGLGTQPGPSIVECEGKCFPVVWVQTKWSEACMLSSC